MVVACRAAARSSLLLNGLDMLLERRRRLVVRLFRNTTTVFPVVAERGSTWLTRPNGYPRLVEQHKNIQRQGDAELKGTADTRPESKRRRPGGADAKHPDDAVAKHRIAID
jgi:hypothetical protein